MENINKCSHKDEINSAIEKYEKFTDEHSKNDSNEKLEKDKNNKVKTELSSHIEHLQNDTLERHNYLDIIKNDYLSKIKEKIVKPNNIIEKSLNKYSPSHLKPLFQNLIKKEKLKDILILESKNAIEKILASPYENFCHFNILLLGKSGVGKSTLINGVFEYQGNEGAKTEFWNPIRGGFKEFISDKRKCLRLIDSNGFELQYIDKYFNSIEEFIEKRVIDRDPDKLIHCIWYCIESRSFRFHDIEEEILTRLMNQYDENKLPIIIVLTQNYDSEAAEIMTKFIKKEFKGLKRDISILPVIAREYIFKNKNEKIIIEKEGIDELIKVSFEKSQIAIYTSLLK